ncbi:MAG TPA: aldo/keto reductase [Kofleriaceae bacterium]|nr:aldo/keto reductase [Kofleriaceae bacterium]
MQYRWLGRTGVKVSRLALGTMCWGGDADEGSSAAMFARAREAGVNFIDTADVYNGGRSEEMLGRFMGRARDELVIATKAYFPTGQDPNARGASRFHLVRAVEASLRRMQTDRVDLFYLHRWDDETAIEETLRALDDLVRAGKILYPACSNFAAWQVAHALGVAAARGLAPIVAVQPMYNLVKRQAEVEILPSARALGVAVVPYSPMAGGMLSGKYTGGASPAGARFTYNKMYQTRYADQAYWAAAEAFAALAGDIGRAPGTLAVAWVASHPAVTSVLVGARSVEQLETSLAAADLELDHETRAKISALTPEPPPATDRNEERTPDNYGAR